MSGICGWVSGATRPPDGPVILARMTDMLKHRGPDARRLWCDATDDVAIGQAHLHSFAPRGSGAEPALAETAHAVAAIDGPVYGPPTDPESNGAATTVLRAYQRRGDSAWCLDGPHTVALWDKTARTLYLARDPLGEKPLYYHCNAATNRLVFGSEIKSLLAHPDVPAGVDSEGVALFLTFGWMPAPKTMFAGIRKLGPGEVLRWTPSAGVTTSRYWRLPPVRPEAGDLATFVARAKDLFLRALEKEVRGLDEVGVFLSGGMDSTILIIALKELGLPRIRTFTLGLPENSEDQCNLDIPHARLVADHFGTVHEELNLPDPDPKALLPRLVAQFDDPILTPNCYTKHLLAVLARRAGVNSVLTGSGAGGGCGPYRRFRDPELRKRVHKKTNGLKSDVERFIELRAKVLGLDEIRALLPNAAVPERTDFDRLLQPHLSQIQTEEYPRAYLLANLVLTSPEKVCMVLDRGGLLASVDLRSPHLDRELIEFQMGVPSSFDGGQSFVGIKCLLKQAYAAQVPQAVLEREETGFPCYYWHRGELAAFQDKLLGREAIEQAGMFRAETLQQIVEAERHDTSSKSVGKRTWALTLLSLWHAIHIRKDADWLAAAADGSAGRILREVVEPAGTVGTALREESR